MLERHEVSGLLLAGGGGIRLGGQSKAFLQAGGITLLERGVEQLAKYCGQVLVGLPSQEMSQGRDLVGSFASIIAGGKTRQATVESLLSEADHDFVLIHDVARPLAPNSLFERVLEAAATYDAVAPVIRHSGRDSLALAEAGLLRDSIDRDQLVAIQTPYVFSRDLLAEVIGLARRDGVVETSITSLLTRVGKTVRTVEGVEDNIKVTYPEDWEAVRKAVNEDGA